MSFMDDLVSQVEAVSPKVDITKAGLVTYYKTQYERLGKDGWKQKLASDLEPIAGMKPKNLLRRFDPSRINNEPKTKREKSQYQALADLIGLEAGRIPPKHGYVVSFDGEILISSKCYPKHFKDLRITGDEAIDLANDPEDYLIIFREYFDGADLAEDFCGDPTISISAGEAPKAEKKSNEFGKRASWMK